MSQSIRDVFDETASRIWSFHHNLDLAMGTVLQ